MSNQDNSDALLDALRRVGVVIPDLPAIEVRGVEERWYWHVRRGAFDTMVDWRDASSQEEALAVAMTSLQPWYVREKEYADIPTVVRVTRNEYIDWLKRGIQ